MNTKQRHLALKLRCACDGITALSLEEWHGASYVTSLSLTISTCHIQRVMPPHRMERFTGDDIF